MPTNYSDWKIDKYDVENLLLDPENPRFANLEELSEENILEELIKYENIIDLSLRIAERGFLPTEVIIVCDIEGKLYVLEGNRRLAACKLLLNPSIAPDKYQKRFKAIAKNAKSGSIKKINGVLAPSRKDADYIIAGRHTEIPIKKWLPINQAIFYYRRIRDGETINNLSLSVGVKANKIKKLIVSYNFIQRAHKLPISKKIKDQLLSLENGNEKEKFEFTTLDRVVQSKPGKDYLKVTYNDNGNIEFIENEKKTDIKLKQIVEDIANKEVNSRNLSTADAIEDYLSNPGDFKKSAIKNQIPKTLQFKSIIPDAIICEINNERIKDIFRELHGLNPKTYPNAHAVTFRLLVELGTYIYMERSGELKKYKNRDETKLKSGKSLPDTWPSLKGMLLWLSENDIAMDPQIKKALKKYVDFKGKEPILDDLNSFVHNASYIPDRTVLSDKWKKLSEYLRHVLKKNE